MPSILIIDDHTIIRRGIYAITEDTLNDIEIQEAGSALEGLAILCVHPSILEKMHLKNNAELTYYTISHQLGV